jgi:hypothetical protein
MKKLYITLLACVCLSRLYAQNTSSPYSIIGLGDIEKSYFDRTSGLGYGGIALTSDRYLLLSNPASAAFLPKPSYSNSFFFEVATRYRSVSYSGSAVANNTTNQSNDLQFKKIAFAIKPKANWALGFGLMPFSSSNYSFDGVKKVQGGTFDVDANYSGTGSTNLFYLNNSFLITKNLSVGIQSSLLFGQINDNETVYSSITDSVLSTNRNLYLSNTYFKGGIIYNLKANKNLTFAFGATGSLETKVNANYELTVKDGNTILKSVNEKRNNYTSLPLMGTVGLAATYKNKYTFVADYVNQNWSSLNYRGSNYSLTNSSRMSAGIQYVNNVAIKDVKGGKAGTYEKNSFQLGYYYNKSYLNVYGQQIKEWGVTMGVGAMLPISGLGIQGTLEIGSRGNTSNGLIKENITQIGVTISYRDNWFTKKIKKYN